MFLNLFVHVSDKCRVNVFIHRSMHKLILQDEDFVIDKDDGGSPTDDSGEEGSDASESGGEKEVTSEYTFIYDINFYLNTK